MLDAIVIIIVAFALALGALVYLYIRYIGTPAGQWKLRLRRHISDLQYKLAAYNDAIAAAAPKITALSHQLYERQLRALTPDALSDYAGIGPGTVERLRNAGLRSVPDIERYHLESIGANIRLFRRMLTSSMGGYIQSCHGQIELDGMLKNYPQNCIHGICQSSTMSPGTRLNSRVLLVTSMQPFARAIAAICISKDPITWPVDSR